MKSPTVLFPATKVLLFCIILITVSCQRSPFATTSRVSHNGRISYINRFRLERRSHIGLFSHRKIKKPEATEDTAMLISKNENVSRIMRVEKNDPHPPDQLIASASKEPLLPAIKPLRASVTLQSSPVRLAHPDTISEKNKTGREKKSLPPRNKRKTEKYGLQGFILSFPGLLPVMGLPFAITAIILGFRSLRNIRRNPSLYKGRCFAVFSIILGFTGLISTIIGGFLVGLVIAMSNYNQM
jgi:hypothetical protein